jgi:hypothetical protein
MGQGALWLAAGLLDRCRAFFGKGEQLPMIARPDRLKKDEFPGGPFVIDEPEACYNHYDPDADKAAKALREGSTPPGRCISPPAPPP